MPTLRTFCSGGELFGIGAIRAGYQHMDGFEIKPSIAAVARQNGFTVHAADVCGVDFESLVPSDHLHGSPSCKRASHANVKAGEAPDDLAVADALCRAIRAHRGTTFTLENVMAYRWFESYDRICQTLVDCGFVFPIVVKPSTRPAWRAGTPRWNDAGEFLDAADFGVPQNRKRLILRAVRGRDRVPGLRPTHSKRGGVLLERWRGWYGAIEDILHTLPETEPAKWQQVRMPKWLRESTLFPSRMSHDRHGNAYGPQSRGAGEPAQTISTMTPGWWRAYLIGTGEYDGQVVHRSGDEPTFTMTATDNSGQIRAYIVGGGNTQLGQIDSHARPDDAPMFTESAAALLLNNHFGDEAGKSLSARTADEPAQSITVINPMRAYVGRWVRMNIQALGRFQTVPDDYRGLTPETNGNGVPCDFAEAIMGSLRGCYS